ncbi:class I SAM-dependent methyltransferase [Limnoraphis robusta]|uniref:Methyltransferase n=1 Tax=Limnoraphis robusta CS-951 TaxID=1637645 RepID=A0A0F5YLM6_9CYAN|nr:class I SAM-dependent methyltransferase [Limnoraphis robusta]KKD39542.1 methyltransferase [Limnoraphis robusta CS-951]
MQRVLEPEVMDTWEEAVEYDSMDFTAVNTAFAEQSLTLGPQKAKVLDAGTGTARIPILIAQHRPDWEIIAIDLSENMLKIGQQNVDLAKVQTQIQLERVDAKQLPYSEGEFDLVISNSIIHHLSDPIPFLRELKRVLKPQGGIFLRDLLRPVDEATRDELVEQYAGDCNAHQKQLFRDSLQAAFTLEEVNQMIAEVGLENVKIYQSSDRHWTVERAAQS